jgi:hypothetical protein
MKERAAPYVVIASLVLAFIWFSVTRTEHPREEISAIIEGVTFGRSNGEHAVERTALIRMLDGVVAEARIVTPEKVQRGNSVRVLVYDRTFAGRAYEVVAVQGPAPANGQTK